MFTPEFWKDSNKVGNALYRINQSEYKEYCEIDQFWVYLADTYPEHIDMIEEIFQEYAIYVEEESRIRDLKKFLNNPETTGRELKYKLLEAQL